MSSIGLHDLVAALASAVAEAEQVVRVHQIRNLRSFFTDANEPVSVDIQVPRSGPGKGDEPVALKVPLITMVNVGTMSIAEMEIQFSTAIGDVSGECDEPDDRGGRGLRTRAGRGSSGGGEPGDAEAADSEQRGDLGWTAAPQKLAVAVSTGLKSSDSGAASITLRVRQAETPEGLARILSRLHSHL